MQARTKGPSLTLEGMSAEDLRRVVQSVEKVKPGRPGRE